MRTVCAVLTCAILLTTAFSSAAQAPVVDTPTFMLATANSGSGVTFSADGSRILTAGQAFTPTDSDPRALTLNAQVWDASTGDLLLTLSQPGLSSLGGASAVWNADETRILTRAGFSARLWDAQTGDLLQEFTHETATYGALLSPDETRVLTWAYGEQMAVWDANTGDRMLTLPTLPDDGHKDEWLAAQWSAEGSEILASFQRGHLVWDTTSGAVIVIQPSDHLIADAEWDAAGRRVIYATNKGEAYLWGIQFADAQVLKPADERTTADAALLFGGAVGWNGDESRFFIAMYNNRDATENIVQVWDAASGELLYTLPHTGRANCTAWSADDTRLLVADGSVHIWNLTAPDSDSGHQVISSGTDELYTCARWNEDGTQFVAWNPFALTVLHVYDTATGEEIVTINDTSAPVLWRGTTLITSNFDGEVKFWSVE